MMHKYLVTAERLKLHQAVVEAENDEEAVEAYLGGEWVEDRGETEDDYGVEIFSVEELTDEGD